MPDLSHFAELGLSAQTIAALEKKGFEEPTQIQKECIPLLLKEQMDVVGQAQTGTGKTAAFGLPILEIVDPDDRAVQALILAPTRELAVQVAEEINSLKGDRQIEVAAVYGGASMELQLRKLRKGVQVVVGTPGRVLDHLKRGTLRLENLKFAVLDEADEMLDMGFIEDIEAILSQTPSEKRMLCFSATMPDPILRLAEQFMKNYRLVRVKQDTMTSVLTDQIYFEVREADKLEALCRIIDMEENFYGLIFCRTKVQCDEIGRRLVDRGYDAEALHGDLSQKQRELILHKMKDHLTSIVVATDVAARGIDIQDLTHVINYSIPQDPEAYIHRVGRTGRAGKMGTAITFITPQEFRKFSFIKRVAKTDIRKESIPDANQIIQVKRARIFDKINSILTSDGDEASTSDAFRAMAQELLEDRDPLEVVAALLNDTYKDDLDVSQYRPIGSQRRDRERDRKTRDDGPGVDRSDRRRDSGLDDHGYTRLFIAKGHKDGLDKRMLVDYITQQTGAESRDLQGVEVMEEFSFVTAPFQVAEKILREFSETSSEGKPIVTKARPDNPNGKNLSSRTAPKRRDRDYDRGGRDDRRRSEGRSERRSDFGRENDSRSGRFDDRPRRSGGRYDDRATGFSDFGGRSRRRDRDDEWQPYGRDTRDDDDYGFYRDSYREDRGPSGSRASKSGGKKPHGLYSKSGKGRDNASSFKKPYGASKKSGKKR